MKTINTRTKSLTAGIILIAIALFFVTPKLFSKKPELAERALPAAAPAESKVITDAFVVKRETITDELQTTGTIAANREEIGRAHV